MRLIQRTAARPVVWATVLVVAAWLAATGLPLEAAGPVDKKRSVSVEAVFSPGESCRDRLIEEIASARKSIRVQMYIFTSRELADALGEAAKGGVAVTVILDQSCEQMAYAPWKRLLRDGAKVFFDRDHKVSNNKIMLIDDRTVITGSYNFTKAAEEKNAENILILKNHRKIFDVYLDNFEEHLSHARSG
jgi:phosphatidylserine/phosphatidylglycerophosphate/cardiolipin synthase-like enzyme